MPPLDPDDPRTHHQHAARPDGAEADLVSASSDPLQSPPGLPGIHSWPAMYAVVLATFVLWDVLLTSLSWIFP